MSNGEVALTVNGREVRALKDRLLIDLCEELGIFVPRFCYHPGMKSVAVCRMCLVKIEGQRKLQPACATSVTDGMVVDTVDENAIDAQEGMLEFLLVNHPLDCPICDRAGECPLQDQTYRHGPGSSRYVEPKRTYEKALEISDLVVLDRERCVLCWRCVRFADEIAGDRFIQLVDRGSGTQILTFADEPFDSYFSGNTIQICPVGALTAKPYRFVSRPWDLKTAPSVCSYCSVGCPITNEARAGQIVRCQALPNENVNDFWICDKGRFGYHYVDSDERLDTPLVRRDDEFATAGWSEAFEISASKIEAAKGVGVLAGGHLTTEDAHGVAKLAKSTIGTRDVDSRIQDAGAPYELMVHATGVAGSSATINDVESAATIVWAGPDPKEALPVLYLKIRKAVFDNSAKLIVVSPVRSSLDLFATHVLRCAPGTEATELDNLRIGNAGPASHDLGAGEALVCCWGQTSPGRDESAAFAALIALAAEKTGKVLVCPPHAGSQGMLDMGVHPGLDAGYEIVEEPGRDTRAILEAAAAGDIDVLVVAGADLIADFPDADLARRALTSGAFVIAIELFPTETVRAADVVFPSASYAEREGTFTNLERRLQKLEQLLSPPGTAREAWKVCSGLAGALGDDWGWRTFDDVWADITANVPTHDSVDVRSLAQEHPAPGPHQESGYETMSHELTVAGPGGQYPKGYRSGAPFQTGQNWPLSWELRGFEARQRPGLIPNQANGPRVEADGVGVPSRSSAPLAPAEASSTPTPSGEGSAGEGSAGEFVLLTGRHIYDEGSMVSKSTVLRNLAKQPHIVLNPEDAEALGLTDGDNAVVEGGGMTGLLPVTVDDIAKGAVYVPYDQRDFRANVLIRGQNPTVRVRQR